MRIWQLPPLIANQIAAGEVIERPASVVKELLENSLDAGADAIAIEIGYGGLNQIKVSDNGTGIVAEDLPLALAAHATSKIRTLDDLYAIDSMGFRGEALASIASVAKVTLISKTAQQETAMMLRAYDGERSISPCAHTIGTTVDVSDLFFNAPVRKKFLKTEKIEFQAIETVIKRFALSSPGIAITLKHNGKRVLSLPAATSEQAHLTRMSRIFGSAFMHEAIHLEVERGAMKLCGWISGIHYQRSQNDRLWVYINQRMVKDKLIYHALKQAYDGLLHPGRFPACVLYLTMKHAEVDVNVHPTKHEVRFQQPRLVLDFFISSLGSALKSANAVQPETHYELSLFDQKQTAKIYEPYPKLVAQEEGGHELSWVILNKSYILAFIHQHPYVVNVMALQHYALQERLSRQTLPWAGRPLLVAIRYTMVQKVCNITELIQHCGQLGIHLEYAGNGEVLVRSIPVCMPYLDLRLFLDAATALEVLCQNKLIELMKQAQVFELRLLSSEEKMELNELLLKMQVNRTQVPELFKIITSEDCQNLLRVCSM